MSGVGDSPSDYLFAFQVIYAADEETIIIKDCLHLVL
jgi:hypothetical protein